MKGVIGAHVIKAKVGNFVVRIECRDEESCRRVIQKLRLVGIYVTKEKGL